MRKFVVFRLGEMRFGIDIGKVAEILKTREPKTLPSVEDFISGVITLRGAVIPLIDMRKRFAIEPLPSRQRMVLVKAGGDRVGLVVDEVFGIRGISAEDITKPSVVFRGLKEEYLEGIARQDEDVIIILDIDSVLTAQEMIRVKEAVSAAGNRTDQ